MFLVISIIMILLSLLFIIIIINKVSKRKVTTKIFQLKIKPPKTIDYLKRYLGRIIGGTIIKIIGTLMDLLLPYILAFIIDEIVPTKDWHSVIKYGLLMILCALIGFLGNVIANQLASKVAEKVTRNLRHDLYAKIQSLSASQLDDISIPSLVSRMTSDTYNIHHMTGMIQRIGTRAPILLIGGMIVTFTLDSAMTMVLLCILPLLVLVSYLISKSSIHLFTGVQQRIDNVVKTIRENTSGVRVIKALSKEEYEVGRFEKVNKDLMEYELKSGYVMARLNPITTTLLNFGLVGVIVVGAFRVNDGIILPGKVIAFTTYFTIILNAMLSITRIFMVMTRSIASGVRIDYVFHLKPDLKVEESKPIDSPYHIEFNNVSFSYNKRVNNITNISFKIKKGESLGIIGATGSGKTTITNFLMRLYDVDCGEILIDGINIKSIDPLKLKKMFGVAFQSDTIFSSTIRENIDFGRNYTLDEVNKALQISQADSFVNALPEGLNTILNAKGTNLSGGQRQRILIARAILGKPDILILDDSSSALDYKTDANLRQEIKNNLDGTTTIIVAQRISSILNCDHILVLDDGEEVGFGTHEELMRDVDVYRETYQIQMGGGNNE
ncbi:MAG: ABC transporter ATP-binding protein [Bacilli bacterium]